MTVFTSSSQLASATPLRAMLAAGALLASAGAAQADTVLFNINFGTGTGQTCTSYIGCSPATPRPPFAGSFTLDEADLLAGGSFNIHSVITLGDLHTYDSMVPFAVQSYTAVALVSNGAPTSVNISYSGSTIGQSHSFTSSSTGWTAATTSSIASISSTTTYAGSYTITAAVPEPSSAWLLALGLLVVSGRLVKQRMAVALQRSDLVAG